MPKITTQKAEIKNFMPIPPGIYEVELQGFAPKLSSKRDSVNLNPVMKLVEDVNVNGQNLKGQNIFDNLNNKAYWIHEDFCHCFGIQMFDTGDAVEIPGDFVGPQDNPAQWKYEGPLVPTEKKLRGKLEVKSVPNQKGGVRTAVNKYFCAIPYCTLRHSDALAS